MSIETLGEYPVTKIKQTLFPSYPIRRADAIVAFGAASICDQIAAVAAALLSIDAADIIIPVGGARTWDPAVIYALLDAGMGKHIKPHMFLPHKEAPFLKNLLLKDGVTPEQIIRPERDTSKNAGANIATIKPLIRERGIKSILAVAWSAYAQRTLQTFRKDPDFNDVTIIPVSVDPFGLKIDDVLTHPKLRKTFGRIVLGEMRKLDPEAEENYINTPGQQFCTEIKRGEECDRIRQLPPIPGLDH